MDDGRQVRDGHGGLGATRPGVTDNDSPVASHVSEPYPSTRPWIRGDVARILLRPDEAAAALAISERALRDLDVPCVRIGRLRLYRPEGLAEWARQREDAPKEVRHAATKVGNGVGLQAPFGQPLGRGRPRSR